MDPEEQPLRDDLLNEVWREYEFGPLGARIIYLITEPLELARLGDFHAVLDKQGVVHVLPVPGVDGCVIRIRPKNDGEIVAI